MADFGNQPSDDETPNESVGSTATVPKPRSDGSEEANHQRMVNMLHGVIKTLISDKLELERQLQSQTELSNRSQQLLHNETAQLDEFRGKQVECQLLQERCDQLRAHIHRLQAAIEGAKAERNEAIGQCRNLLTEAYALRSQTRRMESVQQATALLQANYDQLQEAFGQLRSQNGGAGVTINGNDDAAAAHLVSEMDSLKQVRAIVEAQLARAKKELQEFRSAESQRATNAEAQLAQSEQRLAHLRNYLRRANEEIRHLQEFYNTLDATSSHRSEESDQMQQLRTENVELNDQLSAVQHRNSRLEEYISRLEKVCDHADASEKEYMKKVRALQSRILELQQQKELAAASKAAMEKCVSLQEAVKQKNAIVAYLELQLVRADKEYRAVCLEMSLLEASIDPEANNNTTSSGTKLAQHVADGASLCADTTAMADAETCESMEQELRQLRERLDRIQKDSAKLREENQQLTRQSQSQVKDDSPGRIHRAASLKEGSGSRRPLAELATPNSPAGNLFTSTNRVGSRSKFFPPIGGPKK